MNLEDKARETPDIDLARQAAPGIYQLEGTELEPADDLSPEGEFPQFGDFLWVKTTTKGDLEEASFEKGQYIEVPQDLARWLVENVEQGDVFRVLSVQKVDGEWRYDCELVDVE